MPVTKKSLNELLHVAVQLKCPTLDASSRADVTVGPGVLFAPLLVPSHGCEPVESRVIACPVVRTLPSKIVLLAPSTRTLTVIGAADADAQATAHMRAVAAPIAFFMGVSLP